MGLIQKKDEKDEIDGIQIIERGEGPDGDEDEKIDLVAGTSAEHIAAGTTAEEEDARLEAKIAADAADENLMPEEQDEDDSDAGRPCIQAQEDDDCRLCGRHRDCCGGRLLYWQWRLWRQGGRLVDPHRGPARFDRGKL